jgi:hypothetical protein
MAMDITALYGCLDDFCKLFDEWEAHRLIPSETARQRTGKLSRSEMLFIMVLFHVSPFKNFKVFPAYALFSAHFCGKSLQSSNIDIIQLEQPVGHWRGTDACPKQPRHHRGEIVSPIEAVFERGEITRHMLLIDRPVGPGHRGLDIP